MNFENKIISLNLIKIIFFLVVIQTIIQYIIILYFLNNYNKYLTKQIINLFIKLIKNQIYKKINFYLFFCNRCLRLTLITLIELLLNTKKNTFMIKFLFKLLKIC